MWRCYCPARLLALPDQAIRPPICCLRALTIRFALKCGDDTIFMTLLATHERMLTAYARAGGLPTACWSLAYRTLPVVLPT